MHNLKYLIIIVLIALWGCSSNKTLTTKYYVIEKPAAQDSLIVQADTSLNAYCEIEPVELYPAFAVQQIANRTKSHEIVYYNYHQWAVRPERFFTLMLQEYFIDNKLFAGAATRFWRINPDYKLQTTIYQLETTNQGKQLAAHIAFRMSLISTEESQLICEHRVDRTELLAENDLNYFALTVGKIFTQEMNKFSDIVIETLKTPKTTP
jgi:ABC-type uncharacterized transport system auxiliary subunit